MKRRIRNRKLPIGLLTVLASFVLTAGAVEGISFVLLKAGFDFSRDRQGPEHPEAAKAEYLPEKLYAIFQAQKKRLGVPDAHETVTVIRGLQERRFPRPLRPNGRFGFRLIDHGEIHQQMVHPDGRVMGENFEVIETPGRRRTIGNAPGRPHHLHLFGCSYVYGSGLADAQTLSSVIARSWKNTNAWNYGLFSGGPIHFYGNLKSMPVDAIKEGAGNIGLYLSIPVHLGRMANTMRWAKGYRGRGPVVVLNAAGEPEFPGVAEDVEPLRTLVLSWLSHSNLLDLFRMDVPPHPTADVVRRFAAVVAELRSEYLRRAGKDSRFYYVFLPNEWFDAALTEPIRRELRARGVEWLDFAGVDYGSVPGMNPRLVDGHPSHEANLVHAELLRRALEM